MALRAAVFLDRDGTIIEDKGYISTPDQVVLFPGAADALKQLSAAGFLLFIVSNQSGVGRGYFGMSTVERVNEHLGNELARAGVRFSRIYFAPEAPGEPSRGRKPSPQFLFDARDEYGLDLASSYMIGDKLIDIECGWNAGVRQSILVRTGYGAETAGKEHSRLSRALVVNDLNEAAASILNQSGTPV